MLRLIYRFIKGLKVNSNMISIDTFEWNRSHVMTARLSNNPQWDFYTTPRGKLCFSLWELAHSVIKADYLIQGNLLLPSIGFLLSGNNLLKFSCDNNLRMVDDINHVLNDVTLTSYSGRLGQGITLLLANKLGYAFVGHLASDPHIKRISNSSGGKKPKIADFLFEDNIKNRTIFESKASTTIQTNDTSYIKSKLKSALSNQVIPWVNTITDIKKGYAVHSSLRGETQHVNSSISYVDPPSENNIEQFDLDADWTKTKNYAAWFAFLNYRTISNILFDKNNIRNIDIKMRKTQSLQIIQINNCKFVILRKENIRGEKVIAAGVEFNALKSIEDYLTGNNDTLINYKGISLDASLIDFYDENNISIFPDGTFIGKLDKRELTNISCECILPENICFSMW